MRRNYAAQDNATSKAFLQLATAADEFERYDHPHAARIAKIADEIAKKFHMAAQDLTSLRAAALLHDLGEVAMEREYIQRAGRLTDDEKMDLARHPVIGEQECARVGADRAVQLLVRWHHEWWNGCGYPDALRQAEIPLAARVLRLADSYAALTDTRPYRPAMAEDEARKAIIAHAGIEFDPKVVLAFIELDPIDEMHAVAGSRASAEGRAEPTSLFPNFIR